MIESRQQPADAPPSRWRLLLTTFGGAGLLRPAPGTWGSLAATILLYMIHRIALDDGAAWPIILAGEIAATSIANVALGKWIVATLGEDPGCCVLDEAAGIGITLIALPMSRPLLAFALAFGAFRLFDVLKPPPARQLEHLPLGWGILLDDWAAAIYANLACQLILRSHGLG